MKALAGTLHLLPVALGPWARTYEHGDHGRGGEDYHKTLIDVARVVGISEPANRHVRRLS
jgi:hypothetical protein